MLAPMPPPSPASPHGRSPRSRARRAALPSIPLGSLTQLGARTGSACRSCGSERVTHIALSLTDGSPVQLVSCHRCEHRTWWQEGAVLPVENVLTKARKHV